MWIVLFAAASDIVTFRFLTTMGLSVASAHLISFLGAVHVGVLTEILVRGRLANTGLANWRLYLTLILVSLAVVFLRGGVIALASAKLGWTDWLAMIPIALLSHIANAVVVRALDSSTLDAGHSRARIWQVLSISLVTYMALLRLVYLGLPDLIPEEAYYWNYSQHLDWGYLDHPPMVAWVIKAGTVLLGGHEFGVRIGAFLSWLVTGLFVYRMTRALFGAAAALATLVMLSIYPFFAGIGTLLTPDAPVTACWAGTLYFLQRALLANRKRAWIGVALCLGFGLLSKYTIGLLIPATLLLVLIDQRSRIWLRRPQPYLALAGALLFFAPVIYWNWRHEWISFAFQTTRRWNEATQFSLHLLLGSALFLLTPTGLAAAVVALWPRIDSKSESFFTTVGGHDRYTRFVRVFTLVPLAVFALFSLTHQPKLNWTGPTWLVTLPMAAWFITAQANTIASKFVLFVKRLFLPTAVVMALVYSASLHWLILGMPGVPYPRSITFVAGWKELSDKINDQVHSIQRQTGRPLLIAGLDRYNLSSELAFYRKPDGPLESAGAHLFGQNALMYRFWFPEDRQVGKDILLVARSEKELLQSAVATRFDSLTEITTTPVHLNGQLIDHYYSRAGFRYRGL